jgi:hypothetical protein
MSKKETTLELFDSANAYFENFSYSCQYQEEGREVFEKLAQEIIKLEAIKQAVKELIEIPFIRSYVIKENKELFDTLVKQLKQL